MTVLLIVPARRRPHRVTPLLESIEAATPEPHRVVFIASEDDDAEQKAIADCGANLLVLPGPWGPGDYARKVNFAYRNTDEALLFLGADDLYFHPGWFELAQAQLTDGVGVVGTNDLGNRRTRTSHSTHSLVTRSYADEFGTIDEPQKILHEGYPHEFCDDELVATAKRRGAYVHERRSIVEHLHPHWGKAEMDDLYADEPNRMIVGRRVYQERRRLWK